MNLETFLGIPGAALVLFAFIMEQTGKWNRDSVAYDGINFFGATLLVAYAISIGTYPFAVLNSIWGLVSLSGLMRRIFSSR